MIEGFIFDFDGTVADTYKDIADSINTLRKKLSLRELSFSEVKKNIGYGMENLIKRSFPEIDYATALNEFRKIYYENCVKKTRVYEGMDKVLNALNGRKAILITNKPFYFTMKIIKDLKIDSFYMVIGSDSLPFRKPDLRLYEFALKICGLKPEATIAIGDREHDLIPLKKLGGLTAFARWGYGVLNKFKPDFMVSKPVDLLKYI